MYYDAKSTTTLFLVSQVKNKLISKPTDFSNFWYIEFRRNLTYAFVQYV